MTKVAAEAETHAWGDFRLTIRRSGHAMIVQLDVASRHRRNLAIGRLGPFYCCDVRDVAVERSRSSRARVTAEERLCAPSFE
jgi:hypothetical protein